MNNIAAKNKFLIPTLLIFALFLIVPFLAFPELIFAGKTLYWTDITWIHYPGHIFVADEWLAGRVPLWDPFRQAGKPMLAETQIGVLYPLRAIFLSSLSPSLELSLFLFMHYTLAACFAFILARSLSLSRWGATLAGLSFGFGGFLMAQNVNVNIMTGAVWLPLMLWGAIETLKRRSWLVAILAGIPIALQISTAQPQITFYSLVMMSGYGVYKIVGDFFLGPHRYKVNYALITGLLMITIVVSGLLLAAPQLIPTIEMLQFTVRLASRGFELLIENSLPPALWLNLLLPSAFGNNVVGFKGGDPFQEDFIYVGFIPLLLVLFSWPRRRQSPVLFFMLLLLSAVLLAMGRYTPFYATIIQYLPGFDLFRIPSRWVLGVNLALAILAGVGLDVLLKQGVSKTTLMIVLAIGSLLIIGLGLAWLGQAVLLQWAASWSNLNRKLLRVFFDLGYTFNPIYEDRLLVGWLPQLTVPVVLLTTNIIIAAGLFTLYARRLLSPTLFAGLILAAVTFDLIVAGGTVINPIKDATRWQQLSGGAQYVLERVGQARVFPLGASAEETSISHLGQYFPSVHRVHSAGGYLGPMRLQRYEDFINEAHPVQAIQILGVRYLLTPGQMGADVAATYPLAYSDDASYVYENPNPLPRAFVVHDIILADGPTDALAYFTDMAIDPRQTAVIEAGADNLPPPQTPTTPSTATILHEDPQSVEIAVTTTAAGYLILLDTYYPGWIATIDGDPTPIYPANTIGRAIYVPPGDHGVKFDYRPLSFRVGVGLFGLMVVIIIGAWLWRLNFVKS
ncbi:MAG: hypothetical protein KDJ97_33480 [Anaerolineae bacterium]|nr:hypothetical protein [Anaerolineae bacterium]